MLRYLESPVMGLAAIHEADEKIGKGEGPVQISGVTESLKSYLMLRVGEDKPHLLVSYDEQNARKIFEDVKQFDKTARFFPEKDLLFYQADIRSNTIVRERMETIRAIISKETKTVVTTALALMNVMAPSQAIAESMLSLEETQQIEQDELARQLVALGYERVVTVEEPGQFAVHGEIVDIFDMTAEWPVRIDFFDGIETIWTFKPETQMSYEHIEKTTIFPAGEFFVSDERKEKGRKAINKDYQAAIKRFEESEDWEAAAALQNVYREVLEALDSDVHHGILENFLPYFYEKPSFLTDYLPEDAVISVEEPQRMSESAAFHEKEFVESHKNRAMKGLSLPKNALILRSVKELFRGMETGRTLLATGLDTRASQMRLTATYRVDCTAAMQYNGNFFAMTEDLLNYQKRNFSMVLLVPSRTRAQRVAEELRQSGLRAYFREEGMPVSEADQKENISADDVKKGTLLVTPGALQRGFILQNQQFVLLTESDLLGGAQKKQKKRHQPQGQVLHSLSDLKYGDFVVHENHGIGVYQGIVQQEFQGNLRDYMKISYGNTGTLYIPVTNLDVVQKYASADSKPPRLSRLDTPEWGHTKSRVKAAVEEVAEELVLLYAQRSEAKGHVYDPDTTWQQEFEELFPYDETDDQLQAIADVKKDMESGKIMDRLLLGDVGFGKTEVAIRAAFKAVQEGKQVAYLVPTTILCKQHYNTFRERMKGYPIEVRSLSRFSTGKEVTKTLSEINSGRADIIIGTHKLLSDNVRYKDLGLLIIDEEQRFGVKHKEKIKQLKKNVDVLTLTATPIPRTLHMAMIGIRDMSVLTEPPEDRKSVQTYVAEYEEEIVREAILRETARGGQVYVVYNRTADISSLTAHLQEILPDTTMTYVHGKMKQEELENRMLSFIEGEIDVLVSTTIIETGVDIPNVNTIIICDAERYGLSQLYQLRGRVGRSHRQAYAFIMYRKDHVPSEEAQKRLEAIRQFTELGSGVKIAEQDLEIRGAGALLGNAQSGHMMLVGYDLYSKMLRAAVKKAKGEEQEETQEIDTTIELSVTAYIPDEYMPNEEQKLDLYKRISCLQNEKEVKELEEELWDRYGEPPYPVRQLLEVIRLRIAARQIYIQRISGDEAELKFYFAPNARLRAEGVPEIIDRYRNSIWFQNGETPMLVWRERNKANIGKAPVMKITSELLKDFTKHLSEKQ